MPLTDQEISKKVGELRKTEGSHICSPQVLSGVSETLKVCGDPLHKDAQEGLYAHFKTDKGVKTRTSSYTQRFRKKYPGVKSLPEIAKATKIPLKTLQTVYNRGLAAWRTGHRPGASPQAWGYARVHSFVTKGKTYYTADKDLR